MEKIGVKDLLKFNMLSGLAASPDGGKVGFVLQHANEDGDGYRGYIHLYDRVSGVIKRLTSLGDEKSLVWLDDTTILFPSSRDKKLSERVKKGELWTVYYSLDITGGEAQEYMRIPMKVSDITPAGEDRFVLSAAYIQDYPDFESLSDAEKLAAAKKLEAEKAYEAFEEIPFWSNGIGFTAGKRNRLYIYDKAAGKSIPVSTEREQLIGYAVKGDKLLFITTSHDGVMGQTSGLYLYDMASGQRETLVPEGEHKIVAADYVGDSLIVAASDMKTYGNGEVPNLYAYEDGELKLIYENDEIITNVVASDVKLGKYRAYRRDDNYLYFVLTRGFSGYIARVDAAGKLEVFGEENGTFFDFVPVDGGFVAIGQRGVRLQELYLVREDGSEERLSSFNEDYYNSHSVVKPNHFTYTSSGDVLDGWVMLPPDFDETKKYPAILNIHGGPKTAYGSLFMHEMQVWANAGYVVMYTNPHGSAGKGDEFADIRGKYGTVDYEDIICFVNEVLWRYGCIDPERKGVTGGSYGGFMTNWIVGHTDRFKAAATQRSIANWVSFFGTTDIGYFFGQDQMAADPWNDVDKLWWHSPLKYAKNFKTPTLVIHSDQDLRCWWVEGLQMFTALKYHGVESRMWLCHGENHELSRGGKPKNRIRRLEEIENWFGRFLNP